MLVVHNILQGIVYMRYCEAATLALVPRAKCSCESFESIIMDNGWVVFLMNDWKLYLKALHQ